MDIAQKEDFKMLLDIQKVSVQKCSERLEHFNNSSIF